MPGRHRMKLDKTLFSATEAGAMKGCAMSAFGCGSFFAVQGIFFLFEEVDEGKASTHEEDAIWALKTKINRSSSVVGAS